MTAPTIASPAPGTTQVDLLDVKTPTESDIQVMGQSEKDRYEKAMAAYMQVSFTEQSDLEDLERILFMELMIFRWSHWLMSGKEYDGTVVGNEGELRRWIDSYQTLIVKAKESLKLDKKGRESDAAATFHERWNQLADHAKQFGIMREKQLGRALELMNALMATVRTYDRCDEEERGKIGFPDDASIIQFFREQMPFYDEIDQHFRQNQQRFWIRRP